MADRGHELTDDILAKLEQDIADEYAVAVRDMRNKLTEYLEKDEAKRQVQEKLLNDGAITQQEYNEWCYRHMMMGKRWENMLNALAKDMTKTKEIALKISREKQPDVCALNVNFATYQIEHDGELDTGLSLYNHDAAAHLLEEQRQLMPGPSTKKAAEIAANADMQWNYKKIQSAVLQGILQGESPYDVAKRLNTVGRMNYNDSVRYARTMTTNSQNAGRYQAFRRARDIGVDLTIEWQATLDGRTRHSHRMMHGQRRDVDEPFELDGVKIMWPGNDKVGSSDVPQSMIWNCRCTLLSWVKGFEGETVKESPKMGDMSFEEWQKAKPQYKDFTSSKNNANMTKGGSRQRREKRNRIAEMPSGVKTPKEDQTVVSQLKPIVGKHTIAQDLTRVNPNYDPNSFEWGFNCAKCVTTFEARRRGFDVTALERLTDDKFAFSNGYTLPYDSGGRKPTRLWVAKGYDISTARLKFGSDQVIPTIEEMMTSYGNGARAIVSGYWESGDGHLFFAENVGGKVHFYDPQSGDINYTGWVDRMRPRAFDLFRVDDLPFNSEIYEVVKNDIE